MPLSCCLLKVEKCVSRFMYQMWENERFLESRGFQKNNVSWVQPSAAHLTDRRPCLALQAYGRMAWPAVSDVCCEAECARGGRAPPGRCGAGALSTPAGCGAEVPPASPLRCLRLSQVFFNAVGADEPPQERHHLVQLSQDIDTHVSTCVPGPPPQPTGAGLSATFRGCVLLHV